MIQLTELRKNNLVLHDGKIKAVDVIGYCFVTMDGEHTNYNKIYPVEITEELLLKCGFKQDGFDWTIALTLSNELTLNFGDYSNAVVQDTSSSDAVAIKNPEYIHQLQNLYQSLTGKELEINL